MKKILDGIRYDSDKAVKLGETSNLGRGCDSVTDFSFWEAALYRTPKSGRYFITGSGGPMSRFSQSIGQNTWSGSSDLIPMSEDEAYKWAEDHLTTDEIEAAFPDRIQEA